MLTSKNALFVFKIVTATLFVVGCSTKDTNNSVAGKQVGRTHSKDTAKKGSTKYANVHATTQKTKPASTEPAVKAMPINPLMALSKEAESLEAQGNYTQALKYHLELSLSDSNKALAEKSHSRALEIISTKLTEQELNTVAGDSQYGFLRGHAFWKLGKLAQEKKDLAETAKNYRSVIEFLPGSPLASEAEVEIKLIEASRNVNPKTIGAVLPITGKSAAVAQRALHGLEMGLGIKDENPEFKLSVYDSEGLPEKAKAGVEKLVSEDGSIAIVGSLLSKTALAVAQRADELKVPVIGLSQKSGITDVGPYVFRNALTSEMLVRTLVKVAMEDQGMKSFAILYSNDPYGVEYANLFWDEVLAKGGSIKAVQVYSPTETDFRYPIQRLIGTYYGEARADEFKLRLKELKESEKRKSSRSEAKEFVLPAVVDFDAIFVPDSAKAMGQISAMLAYNDVKGVKLLGTNLWNTPGVGKRLSNTSGPIYFVDSYTTVPSVLEKIKFIADFKKIYGEEPGIIEMQSYDTGLILRKLIQNGASTRDELARKLADLKDFQGSLGLLNILPDREIQRPVIALTVDKGEIKPLPSKQ